MSLAGISKQTRAAEPSRPLTGLRGVSMASEGNLSVKVEDFRGRGLPGVRITTPTGAVFFTDSTGGAFILVSGLGVKLALSKGLVRRVLPVPDGVAQVIFKIGPTLRD